METSDDIDDDDTEIHSSSHSSEQKEQEESILAQDIGRPMSVATGLQYFAALESAQHLPPPPPPGQPPLLKDSPMPDKHKKAATARSQPISKLSKDSRNGFVNELQNVFNKRGFGIQKKKTGTSPDEERKERWNKPGPKPQVDSKDTLPPVLKHVGQSGNKKGNSSAKFKNELEMMLSKRLCKCSLQLLV